MPHPIPFNNPGYVLRLSEIIQSYDGFFIDLWGVVHDGHEAYPGVIDCLKNIMAQKKKIIFLTNAPRRSVSIVSQLTSLGIDPSSYSLVFSSGEAAFEALQKETLGHAFIAASSDHHFLFESLNLSCVNTIEEADFILNTGPHPLDLKAYDRVLEQALGRDLPMICVNPDVSVISKGKEILCAGALANAYAEQGGSVRYFGKPYPEIYQGALDHLAPLKKEKILAIGDSLTTDILGATSFGIDSALTLTGLSGQAIGYERETIPSFEKLKRLYENKGVFPTYVAPGLIW